MAVYETYDRWKDWDEAAFLRCSPAEAAYLSGELAGQRLAGSHILELGFGNGAFLAFARERGAHVYGTEVQERLVHRAGQAGIITLQTDLGDAERKLAEPLDLVVAFDVLEHLTHDEIRALLSRLDGLVKEGGHVVARFPNCQSPLSAAHQYGDCTHRSTLSAPQIGQLALGLPWTLVKAAPPFRVLVGLGLLRRLGARARHACQAVIEAAGNRIYGLDISWAPNVVVWLRHEHSRLRPAAAA